jgi:hypothetical protein
VLAQAVDCRAALRRVAADTFKDARTVMDDVRHDMHARVVPFDELAVVPDFGSDTYSLDILFRRVFGKHVVIYSLKMAISYQLFEVLFVILQFIED